ncbi:hypothetical protein ABEF95_003975 [Exophiala dermatitidis]
MLNVDESLRLAIRLNDVALVQRLLEHHPRYLHNPDFADKSNTSLHLAAQYGLEEIAELLISLGHDSTQPVTDWIYSNNGNNLGISVNTEGQTSLHLAAANSHAAVVELLCNHFPQTVTRRDYKGQTPLHLASSSHTVPAKKGPFGSKPIASQPEDNTSIKTLIAHGADVNAQDAQGNTCLHNASAWGNLKAVRALIQAGADPLCKNKAGWTPEYYSITVQAEVYFRNLVAEWEKRKAAEGARGTDRRAKGGGAVRLVPRDDDSDQGGSDSGRDRAGSGRSQGTTGSSSTSDTGLGISVGYTATWK